MGRYAEILDPDGSREVVHSAENNINDTSDGKNRYISNRPPWADPRGFDPDLQSDSITWEFLLRLAWEKEQRDGFVATEDEPGLHGGLWLLRCNGVRLLRDTGFGYRLEPTIDGCGDVGYENVEAYRAETKQLLDPHRDQLLELLKTLGKALRRDKLS